MRHDTIAVACLAAAILTGCGSDAQPPTDKRLKAGDHAAKKWHVIGEKDVCKLVPAKRISQAFDFPVRETIPTDMSTPKTPGAMCLYTNGADDGASYTSFTIAVTYFPGAEIDQNVQTYETRSGNTSQRVEGSSDLTLYYATARTTPDDTGEPWSMLRSYDQFADGSRMVTARAGGLEELTDLEPIMREAMKALDSASS